ncbi:MAG: hypothetical protein KF880_00220 [Ferruginibacter sp.]|nr:hypothetical protein [Ferruginibacter sp.]
MKHILLIMALWMGAHTVCAQNQTPKEPAKHSFTTHPALKGKKVKRVPDTVRLSFSNSFSGVTSAQWYKKDNLYRVQFTQNGQTHIAIFNEQGERMD